MTSTVQGVDARVRFARVVTELTAPTYVAVVVPVLVAWKAAPDAWHAVIATVVTVVFVGAIPQWYLHAGVRRGRWSNRHVPRREQRRQPLLVALASVLVGLVLLVVLGASRDLLALVVAMVVGLLVSLAVSHFWKMSIHSAVVAGAAVVLALVFGAPGLLAFAVVAVVAWSRVELRDHTVAQATAGCAIGAAVAAAVFPVLR